MTFVIRAATADDAEAIAAIYAPNIDDDSVSFEEHAPSPLEIRDRIRHTLDSGLPWLVAELDDWVVGFCCASPFHSNPAYRFTVETTVYVSADYQRQGIGRRLCMALIRTLSAQGYTQAIALIALPNEESIERHEAVGYQRAGVWRGVGYKDGEWRDVGLWQRSLAVAEDVPDEPKGFAEVGLVLE